ncbi:MAG: NAD(P)-dependent glycerol-3-phosphate dehydrogenase [Planctomycetes bacterium]|nr:NAD(P)-dependent glycerol-3-phosphate dehydrogenase [Planctomycetota bacterium]
MSARVARATIVGDGAMGTLCALMLAERGARVTLWGASPQHVETLCADRENRRYLPGYRFPGALTVQHEPARAFEDPAVVISAVPVQHMRAVWTRLARCVPRTVPLVSVAKGLELETLLRPTDVLRDCVGDVPLGCLSGPCIAPEVAAKKPASVVAAASVPDIAELVQVAFSSNYFRVYASGDLVGVELAGAVKNVIAIAAGICDGIAAGDNAKAALLTRGLAEIARLGMALGASPDTFRGLAGVGDLFTTCVSRIGRNRSAGERIGRGAVASEVIASTPSVIEGIPTTRAVLALARQHHVEMPIVAAVASVLFEGCSPQEAIEALMTRPLRPE